MERINPWTSEARIAVNLINAGLRTEEAVMVAETITAVRAERDTFRRRYEDLYEWRKRSLAARKRRTRA